MLLPTVLFLLFTVLSAVGAYWILSRHVSPKAGIWGALAAVLFFVALFLGLVGLLRSGGIL